MKALSSRKAGVTVLALIFFFMLICNFLTPYQADDFVYHYRFDNGARVESVADIFPSLAEHAKILNGRLAAHFFVHLFEMLPKALFNLVNAGVFTALLLLMRRFICAGVQRPGALITLLVFFAVWVFTPAFGEVFLWLDGSVNYLWAIVLNLVFLLPYYRLFYHGEVLHGLAAQFGLAALAFVSGAFQETASSAAFLLSVVFMLFTRFYNGRRIGWCYIAASAASFAGLLSMAVQPAETSVKSSSASFVSFFHSFLNMMRHFRTFWPLIFIFAVGLTLGILLRCSKKQLILSGIFFFGFLCANGVMLLARIYPARCAAPAAVFLLIADGLLLNCLFEYKYRNSVICLSVLLCTAAVYLGVIGTGDIVSTYAQFKANEATIAEALAAGAQEIYLPELHGCTRYSVAYEMTFPSPIDWVNEGMSKYYGAERIIGYDFYTDIFADLPALD